MFKQIRWSISLIICIAIVGLSLLTPAATPAVSALGFTSTPTNTPVTPTTPVPTSVDPIYYDPLITKYVDVELARVGDPIKFTFVVTNPNGSGIASVVIDDPLPKQVNFDHAVMEKGTYTYDAATHTLVLDIGQMAPYQTITIYVYGTVNELGVPPDPIVNSGTLFVDGTPRRFSNKIVVQTIPGALPETGEPPMWPLAYFVVGVTAACLLGAGLYLRRTRKPNA